MNQDLREKLLANLDSVIERIEKARLKVSGHHIVHLIAVSKYSDEESIKTLYSLGQRAFGESQVQQLEQRVEDLIELPLEWHMIGRLQKNKINKLIDISPSLLHSLDSLELAEALNKRLEAKGKKMNALLQINSSQEASKAGVSPDSAVNIYNEIKESYPNINLKGVMTIGAHTDNRDEIKKSFEITRDIFDSLNGAQICSMGMSGDFELAIECGSNMVRVGSAIFG